MAKLGGIKIQASTLRDFAKWHRKHYGNVAIDTFFYNYIKSLLNPTPVVAHTCPAVKSYDISEKIAGSYVLIKSFTP